MLSDQSNGRTQGPVEPPAVHARVSLPEPRVDPASSIPEFVINGSIVENGGVDSSTEDQNPACYSTHVDVVPSPRFSPPLVVDAVDVEEDTREDDGRMKSSFDARLYLLPEKDDGSVDGQDEKVSEVEVSTVQNDANESSSKVAEKRKDFEQLQDHIDALTTEKMDLSLCLKQQTNIVQRLTQENENMVKRLNDAARTQEALADISKQQEANEIHMQHEMKRLQKQIESRDKENRDLSSKVKVLGNELVMLEEKLLQEKNERLKRHSMAIKDDDSESRLKREIESHKRDKDMLQSTVDHLKEQLRNIQELLRKSELERCDAIASQKKLSDDLQVALKHQKNRSSLPKSALASIKAMKTYEEEQELDTSSCIPPEIKALLPIRTWVPGVEDVQDDMHSISERLYQLFEIAEKRMKSKDSPMTQVSSDNDIV